MAGMFESLDRPDKKTFRETPLNEISRFADYLKGEHSEASRFADYMKGGPQISELSHTEVTPLNRKDREAIKGETGWTNEVVDRIGSKEEYEVYKATGDVEADVNGKPCLVRNDLNLDQKDEFGRTNRERMEQGLAPLDKDGKPYELHHIGQKQDSPLAELTMEQHRGKGNDSILHDKTKVTEIDRIAFQDEKQEHWETRAKEL
jgi:hypothetical protein